MENDSDNQIKTGLSGTQGLAESQENAAELQNNEFQIVGIGASAGGLAAFEKLFTHMPSNSGMAFVVVQHLSAPHKSILPEILQRYTSMPVSQVTDGVELKPNCSLRDPARQRLEFARRPLDAGQTCGSARAPSGN